VDIADVVSAHRLAVDRAPDLRFGRYIISATTPFTRDDLAALAHDAPAVLRRHAPAFEALYAQRGWQMFATLDRGVRERAGAARPGAGSRGTTLPTCCAAWPTAVTGAANWPSRWAASRTTRRPSGTGPTRWTTPAENQGSPDPALRPRPMPALRGAA
jgi:hypothetical protein